MRDAHLRKSRIIIFYLENGVSIKYTCMKIKYALSTIIVVLLTLSANAQKRADIFNPDVTITWLGIDISKAKFIGDRERWGSESDMRKIIDGWNSLFLME